MNKINTDISDINKRQSEGWAYVLFMMWPVIGLFFSLKNYSYRYSGTILVLFFALFGYTHIYSEASDSFDHKLDFLEITHKPFTDFFESISKLYTEDSDTSDIFMDFIAYVVSRFTDDPQNYFAILATTLGIFFVINVNLFTRLYRENLNQTALIFLVFFFVMIPPVRMLSFRNYCALLLFVYAFYRYLDEKKLKFLILLPLTILIHYSFLFAIVLFAIYILLGKRNLLYYSLIVLSVIFADIAASSLRTFGMDSGLGFDDKVKGYTSETYIELTTAVKTNQNVVLTNYIEFTVIFMLLAIIYHKIKIKKFDPVSENMYSFLILLFAFVNFMKSIESIYGRFATLFEILCCVFFIRLYTYNEISTPKFFRYISILFLTVNFIVLTRITIEYANVLVLIPFSPFTIFITSDTTILDLIQ